MNRNLTRVGLAAVLVFSAAAAACGPDGPDGAGAAPAAGAAGAAAAPAGDISPGDTVEFYASEFMFAPADFVAEPGTYTGMLVNDGDIEHDIMFEGGDPVVIHALPRRQKFYRFLS